MPIILCALAALGPATPAEAYWRAGGSGAGTGAAATMPTANQPTATTSARSVTVAWTQNLFQGSRLGSYAGGGYQLKRYAQGSPTGVTPSANCATRVSGTSETLQCVEAGVPYGDWQYSATPVLNTFTGGEGAKSAAVMVAPPALSFSSPTTVTSLPTTLAGSISNFAAGQSVTFRLDDPTTGTVLSGSISPNPVPAGGGASINVTIPAGTADGAHTVYAVGSQGDTASAAITVQALHHFDFDVIGERHSDRSFAVTVRAKDASGQTITSFNDTVNFSVSSGSISPTTSNSFSNGVLTQAATVTGPYTTNQTITATGGATSRTGTSNAFTLHDWKYYFKKTTAYTADANTCTSAYRKRDMAEGYAGSDPEETHTRAGGGTETANFCSPAFAASDTLAAGATTVNAYIDGPAGSACNIAATLYKVGGGVATSLGSASRSITGTSLVLYTFTINNSAAAFSAGDRLNVRFQLDPVKACSETFIHYGGTTYRSHVQLPGPGGSAYKDAVLGTSGLNSFWRLGESSGTTATDSKGTTNGTYTGGVTLAAPGALASDSDKAASFDGVDDHVEIGDFYDFAGTAAFSVELWFKKDTNSTTDWIRLVDKHKTATPRDGWVFAIDPGSQKILFERWGAGSQDSFASSTATQTGRWYHLVGTYDATNMRLYIDGNLEATRTSSVSMGDTTLPLRIARSASAASYFDGAIDDVAIYNTALSSAQVQAHYDAR